MSRIQINIETGEKGLWYATSPEVKGLLVAGTTLLECISAIPAALKDMEVVRRAFAPTAEFSKAD